MCHPYIDYYIMIMIIIIIISLLLLSIATTWPLSTPRTEDLETEHHPRVMKKFRVMWLSNEAFDQSIYDTFHIIVSIYIYINRLQRHNMLLNMLRIIYVVSFYITHNSYVN